MTKTNEADETNQNISWVHADLNETKVKVDVRIIFNSSVNIILMSWSCTRILLLQAFVSIL